MVRVRFAPSPTGYLHVGGARTAIFNWLYARKQGGRFLLRIEDTDVVRSQTAQVDAIFQGLQWLGLTWDESPLYQSSRFEIYRKFAFMLVEQGAAYKCFCSPERLRELRERAEKNKGEYKYDRACLNLTGEEIAQRERDNQTFVIRFKVKAGITSFTDQIYGDIQVKNSQLDDFIILRSDRNPTYHLAVVVDDHEMQITHVIRGEDHLSNTPKHVLLYEAMGWKCPIFVHVPLILGPDRQRLSKRHGATAMTEYQKAGYLPDAMFNFLALLGWSTGDDRELFSKEDLIQAFSLKGIMKKSAVFDEKKLLWMNGQYLMAMSDESLLQMLLPELINAGLTTEQFAQKNRDYLLKIIRLLKTRARRLVEFVTMSKYFFHQPEEFDQKGMEKFWQDPAQADKFVQLIERLNILENFTADNVERILRALALEWEISAAGIIHPTRLAITGRTVSPGLFEIMEMLGKKAVIARLKKVVEYLTKNEAVEQETSE